MNGWMVTEGDYSAYRVLAVFTDHDAACAYAAKRRVMPGPYDYEGDPVRIERVEIDPAGIADGDYSAAVVVTMDVDSCETCKWWGSSDEGVWRECRHRRAGYEGLTGPDYEDTLAYAISLVAPECRAILVTMAEYGCIQWEPKEDER